MAVVDIFSKRKKRLDQAGKPDIYQYDVLPQPFRVQVVHMWRAAIGRWADTGPYSVALSDHSNRYWKYIKNTMCREKGLFYLTAEHVDPASDCVGYLMSADTDGALDIIEISFRVIERSIRNLHPVERENAHITEDPDEAIDDLNQRFLENGIGYQYANGIIMRLDSQFLHAETVRPALVLLKTDGFEGPAEEFMKAFDHYRHGRYKEAVVEALKAFESTMKAICSAREWGYAANATAKPLLDLLFEKGLIPPELQSHFSAFRSAMESGLPTLRNKTSGHGQGSEPKPLPPHFAAYALHLAAANIVFLVEAHTTTK